MAIAVSDSGTDRWQLCGEFAPREAGLLLYASSFVSDSTPPTDLCGRQDYGLKELKEDLC